MPSSFFVFLLAVLLCIPSDLVADSPPSVPASQLEAAKQGKEFFERGDYRRAENVYRAILGTAPDNLYILSNLGVVLFRAGGVAKLKQAEEVLVKATKIAPEDGFSHCTLGIVYYTQGRSDDAIKSLKRAIELNPKDASSHNYLSMAYSSKGMRQEAARELAIARELDPSYNAPEKSPKEIPEKFRINES